MEKVSEVAQAKPERGEDTRQRLIDAAAELFGIHGFNGVTTRRLAECAAANQAAITYYFGGKEGLYIAVAEHIVARITAQVMPVMAHLETLTAGPISKDLAMHLMRELLHRYAEVVVGSHEAQDWARFIIREQTDPSPAFDVLFRGMSDGPLRLFTRLIGILYGGDEADESIRLRAFTMIGQVLIFRTARAAVLKWMGWDDVGADELKAIQDVIDDNLDVIIGAAER